MDIKRIGELANDPNMHMWDGTRETIKFLLRELSRITLIAERTDCLLADLETSQQQVQALSSVICNIQDTCRSQGFLDRPVDTAVIAIAQERDQLKSKLNAAWDSTKDDFKLIDHYFDAFAKELGWTAVVAHNVKQYAALCVYHSNQNLKTNQIISENTALKAVGKAAWHIDQCKLPPESLVWDLLRKTLRMALSQLPPTINLQEK